MELVRQAAINNGAFDAAICTHWADGGAGASALADAVIKACDQPSKFKFLYDVTLPLDKKIEIVAKEMYGAGTIEYLDHVKTKMAEYAKQGLDKLPICMAKTSLSLTGDPAVKGAPTGFVLKINNISISAGAGFIVPIVGEITTMPGLPTRPAIYDIDLNPVTGEIEGLF